MSIQINNAIVGTTAVRLVGYNERRTSLVIYNNHASATVYISGSRGMGTRGFPIRGRSFVSFNIPEDDPRLEVWIISDTATTSVRYYEGMGPGK